MAIREVSSCRSYIANLSFCIWTDYYNTVLFSFRSARSHICHDTRKENTEQQLQGLVMIPSFSLIIITVYGTERNSVKNIEIPRNQARGTINTPNPNYNAITW